MLNFVELHEKSRTEKKSKKTEVKTVNVYLRDFFRSIDLPSGTYFIEEIKDLLSYGFRRR